MTRATAAPRSSALPTPDGRDTRWAEHRITRRAALVGSTLRAIRKHGAGVGMDEIAAEAGTSKTVIYRHFHDKVGLYAAVVAFADELILRDLTAAAGVEGASPQALMAAVVDSYLRLVERDPEVYRFVVTRPLLDRPLAEDPVASITGRIGDHVAMLVAAQLRLAGLDPTPAQVWGHGLVGLVHAAADHWVGETDPLPRAELVRHVTTLVCDGLTVALGSAQPSPPTVLQERS